MQKGRNINHMVKDTIAYRDRELVYSEGPRVIESARRTEQHRVRNCADDITFETRARVRPS